MCTTAYKFYYLVEEQKINIYLTFLKKIVGQLHETLEKIISVNSRKKRTF
jgi:hypothetical protein